MNHDKSLRLHTGYMGAVGVVNSIENDVATAQQKIADIKMQRRKLDPAAWNESAEQADKNEQANRAIGQLTAQIAEMEKKLRIAKTGVEQAEKRARAELAKSHPAMKPLCTILDDPQFAKYAADVDRLTKIYLEAEKQYDEIQLVPIAPVSPLATASAALRGGAALAEVDAVRVDRSQDLAAAGRRVQIARRALDDARAEDREQRHKATQRLCKIHEIDKVYARDFVKPMAEDLKRASASVCAERDFVDVHTQAGLLLGTIVNLTPWRAAGFSVDADENSLLSTWLAEVRRDIPSLKGKV